MSEFEMDLQYWFWLKSVSGIGPATFRTLCEAFGNPKGVFHADAEAYRKLRDELHMNTLKDSVIEKLVASKKDWAKFERLADRHLELASRTGVHILRLDDERYPSLLRTARHVAPPILYAMGEVERIGRTAVSIVGSRKPSSGSLDVAYRLAAELSEKGWAIVSGLAMGIDAAAHKGCLDSGGFTVAVLGCGIDVPYPRENLALYRKIADRGSIISEFGFGTRPSEAFLRRRNKIIVALSQKVVLIESGLAGGSMISALEACDQKKTLFAYMPSGVIGFDSDVFSGNLKLIEEGVAVPIGDEDADSVASVTVSPQEIHRPSWTKRPSKARKHKPSR